jgi:hypothetical protein
LVTYSSQVDAVVEFGFGANIAELEFDGLRLFGAPPLAVLRHLMDRDGRPLEYLGFAIFMELGITIAGFHKPADSIAVTCFERGRWDDVLNDMRPLHA